MRYRRRFLLAVFFTSVFCTWGLLLPALLCTEGQQHMVCFFNIAQPTDNLHHETKSAPTGQNIDHLSQVIKDSSISLSADVRFSHEELKRFDVLAKKLGYIKNITIRGTRDHEQSIVQNSNLTQKIYIGYNRTNLWLLARSYSPAKEPVIPKENLIAIENILVRKRMTHVKRKRRGQALNMHDEEEGTQLKTFQKMHNKINQFHLYLPTDPTLDDLLHDMRTLPITKVKTLSSRGTMMKLLFKLSDGSYVLFKPMRFMRDLETYPDHFYFDDIERYHSEIAAFHLDKVLGFYRVPPNIGRSINLEIDIKRHSEKDLRRRFYRSPVGNICFIGDCSYYCTEGHAICGTPDTIVGSFAFVLPGVMSTVSGGSTAWKQRFLNPYSRSYSRSATAEWETNQNYCDKVRKTPPYNTGRRLLDLIDIHIFDFLTGNLDRHHYHIFANFGNYTSPFLYDNGRGFGKSQVDEVDILAPLYQCCVIRFSTLEKLKKFHDGKPVKLSTALRASLKEDLLTSVLNEDHLAAVDRRVKIILNKVADCIIKKREGEYTVVVDDSF